MRQDFELQLIYVPFELRPDMPEEGLQESELEASGHADGHVEEYLLRTAARAGLEMQIPRFLPKTHLALTLGEFARDLGDETHETVHAAIFAAYFAEGRDIGRREVLLEIAKAHGLGTGALTAAWDSGRYDERLHQFSHLGLGLGIASTPAALICNELLIGSRPYEVLKDAIERCLLTTDSVEKEGVARQAPEDPGSSPGSHGHDA